MVCVEARVRSSVRHVWDIEECDSSFFIVILINLVLVFEALLKIVLWFIRIVE